ncbi:hypothetical protein, partial [Pseudomonas sp. NFACC36]|uniref:hypothetical protein n=3 Tax=unclassified Pseudomonas TaxID=196821 RepID=UPI001C46E208
RPVHLSSGYFQKFSKFPLQLQPLALSISRQREANSTALAAAVNTSFPASSIVKIEVPTGLDCNPVDPLPDFDDLKSCTPENFITY